MQMNDDIESRYVETGLWNSVLVSMETLFYLINIRNDLSFLSLSISVKINISLTNLVRNDAGVFKLQIAGNSTDASCYIICEFGAGFMWCVVL